MYCNYSKDKFDKELTFIIPSWYKKETEIEKEALMSSKFDESCKKVESDYMTMLSFGATPQEARQVLSNAIKTEVCMTGFACDWRHFFALRYYGETGKPHPDMELLASKAKDEFLRNSEFNNNILDNPIIIKKENEE